MRRNVHKSTAIELFGLFFPYQAMKWTIEDGLATNPEGALDWLIRTSTEFLEPGEDPPMISLSTGASLGYRMSGRSIRFWVTGSDLQVALTLDGMPETERMITLRTPEKANEKVVTLRSESLRAA